MPWAALFLIVLALLFSYMGWRWDSTRRRPRARRWPLVSVIIPSYQSPHLAEAVESAKRLDYPRKEILVMNDSPEPVAFEGVRVSNSRARRGKTAALNQATALARGEILFILDADTTAAPDTLRKLVPWFAAGAAAVSPKFVVRNKDSFLTRLIAMETSFISSLYKIHMYFGSLISFRGCGIAIRKDVLERVGGWRETMIEDIDLAATLVKSGHRILYDPEAVVQTREPATWGEFKRQRLRWGRGTGLSFLHHFRFYLRNPQFGVYIFPYLLLSLLMAGVFVYQTTLALLPLASVYLLYSFSVREMLGVLALLAVPLAGNATSMAVASVTHVAVVTHKERAGLKDAAFLIPYVFLFFPVTIAIYTKGVLSAIRDKKNRRPELDFAHW